MGLCWGKRAPRETEVKLARLSKTDDVEAYLTTFKWMMAACEVPKARWVFKLARQQSGNAQQAYAPMPSEYASNYEH